MNRVAVIVLNYKGIEDTAKCLESLFKQSYSNFVVVAVENGSNDGSAEMFKEFEHLYGERLHTIYNETNLGFAGGVNSGITWALEQHFDTVALFNNDAIAEPNWLEELIKVIDTRPEVSIATGLLLHEDGKTIDSTGDWYSKWGLPFPRNRNDVRTAAPEPGYVFSASGGASLYRTSLFREIGFFDETFFAYYEDTDISFRTLLAGYKIYYSPLAVAYHYQGKTSDKMPGHFAVTQTFKNLPTLFLKNVPSNLLFSIGVRFYFAYWLMVLHAIKRGRAKAALVGVYKSITLIPHALHERKNIQLSAKNHNVNIKSLLWNDLPPDQTGLRKLRRIFTRKG